MNKEFLLTLEQLEREKGISKEAILDAIQQALIIAAKKIAKLKSPNAEVRVDINRQTGDIKLFIGDEEVVSQEFGRIAAQTARQVMIQKIREASKDNIYNEFKSKEGQIVSGIVYRIENKVIIVDLMGKAEGILPKSLLSPLDKLKVGDRIKCYVCEVKKEDGIQIILSRKHEGFVKRLFELEVPEILEGIVEIKSVARDPGERTKISVYSKDEKVHPVGACVGVRGARVNSIREELRGEKIDIVKWSDDIKEFITGALAPAIISKIDLDREKKRATILVNKDQLAVAIGKRGQNVRLASILVGWELDVRTQDSLGEEDKDIDKLASVGKKTAKILIEAGYDTIEKIAQASPEKISEIKGIGRRKAQKIIEEAQKKLEG